jgi:hypothetical protein
VLAVLLASQHQRKQSFLPPFREQSTQLSQTRFYNLCPNTDPTQISFAASLFDQPTLSQCAATLEAVGDCTTALGFTSPGWTDNDPWVDLGNLPQNGTESLSNSQGGLASPTSGTSLVWTFGANVYTAIAASATAGGGGTQTTTTSGTATGSAGATGTGTKPSMGNVVEVGRLQALGLRVGVLIMLAL